MSVFICVCIAVFLINSPAVADISHDLVDAAASSHYGDWTPSKVIDGDNGWGSCWSSALHGSSYYTEYIVVKIGNTSSGVNHSITQVSLKPRPDGKSFPRNFCIQYSTDAGTTWYTIRNQQYTDYPAPPNNDWITFSFDRVNGYFVRILATRLRDDGCGNYCFQLDEVEVDGFDQTWPFHSSLSANYTSGYQSYIDADTSNMFSVYGIAKNEISSEQLGGPTVPQLGGLCFFGGPLSSHTHILSEKLAWLDHWWTQPIVQNNVRNMLNYRDSDGYIWTSDEGPMYYEGEGYHFDNNSKFLIGVSLLNCWDGNVSWLNSNIDALRSVMNYQMSNSGLQGNTGMLTIDCYYRPPAGQPDNNGRFFNPSIGEGEASNYWDSWPFGYKSAYDDMYFYASVLGMKELERQMGAWGNVAWYTSMASTIKTSFNNTFWDSSKKRYIGCVDIDGQSHDYGFTFLNLEAMYYGLASQAQADDIFSWLDGQRTISGDTSTGSDIYAYTWAPRSNTKSAESVTQSGHYWWYPGNSGNNSCAPGGPCTWNNYHENGGAILAESYYDVMARIKYKGANNAFTRLKAIMAQYHLDELRRDPLGGGGYYWKFGITGEYPESGLVPMVYFNGFMGVSVDAFQMTITPKLPSEMSYLTCQSVLYRQATLEITVTNSDVHIKCTNNPQNRHFDFMGTTVSGLFDETKSLSGGSVTLVPVY